MKNKTPFRCEVIEIFVAGKIKYAAKIQKLWKILWIEKYMDLEFPHVQFIQIGDMKMYTTACWKENATIFNTIEEAVFCASKTIEDLIKNGDGMSEFDY